jgi:DNA (cytosine-5)-methyltransferase 1
MKTLEKPIPVLSLFCGAGGMDYGFVRAGFKPVLAIDKDATAANTYNFNLETTIASTHDLANLSGAGLIKLLEGQRVKPKGIIGGPPCQGFSFGNTKARPDDPRNLLALKYSDLIGALNKKFGVDFFVFENVLGLKSSKHAAMLNNIKAHFKAAGFEVYQQVLDANAFGVPQRRRRLFLVGLNENLASAKSFSFPEGADDNIKTVRDAIEGLPDPIFRSNGMKEADIPYHPNHWTSAPVSARFKSKDFNTGRSFRRLTWDQPSWTVAYGNREIHIHPNGNRRLSVLEAMLLQKFPKRFVIKGNFCQQVQQVSNAVPPPVARAIASAIRKQLYPKTLAKNAR